MTPSSPTRPSSVLPLSRFYEGCHRAQGVDVRLGVTVDRIASAHGRVSGVHLVSGEVLPCQLVIVGIGIVPAIEPLRAAGAQCSNGVDVDGLRSEEHTSELQSLMRISYAVFCLKKKKKNNRLNII